MKKLSNSIIFLIFTLFFWTCPVAFSQDGRYATIHQEGEILEVALPIILKERDLGKAYPPSLTGLKGIQLVEGPISTNDATRYKIIFQPYQDDFTLNIWGTGLGMYDERLDGQTRVRRARLAIMKINAEKRMGAFDERLFETGSDTFPLLLKTIHYGHAYHLTIAGNKGSFTKKVFLELKKALENHKDLEPILDRYDLSITMALNGLVKKQRSAKIPLSWEEVEEYYVVAANPVPVFGEFLLLDDIKSKKINW